MEFWPGTYHPLNAKHLRTRVNTPYVLCVASFSFLGAILRFLFPASHSWIKQHLISACITEAARAVELLEEYHARLTRPADRQLRDSVQRVITVFRSQLFQALLDIQEYYESSIIDGENLLRQGGPIMSNQFAPVTYRGPQTQADMNVSSLLYNYSWIELFVVIEIFQFAWTGLLTFWFRILPTCFDNSDNCKTTAWC